MRFLGLGLILVGATLLAAAMGIAFYTAPEGQVLNLPVLIGGVVISSFFDVGGIIVMRMGPHM